MGPVDPKVSSTSPSTDSDTSPSRLERHIRRKITKHMVERKRRDRINLSLDSLRCLVLEALNKNPEQYSKMEKADILDMTVKYMKLMRARKGGSPAQEGATFAVGYRACASEVARHLASTTIPEDMKSRILTAISYKTASPPVVPCPTHVIGYHADYTSTPPGWRGVPAHYPHHHHAAPPPPYPGHGGAPGGGTPLRVPAAVAQPRDLNMNLVGMTSANLNTTHASLDNERYHARRAPAAETSAASTATRDSNSAFAHPLQLNVSLNFGGQGRARTSPAAVGADPKEERHEDDEDDMWRPW